MGLSWFHRSGLHQLRLTLGGFLPSILRARLCLLLHRWCVLASSRRCSRACLPAILGTIRSSRMENIVRIEGTASPGEEDEFATSHVMVILSVLHLDPRSPNLAMRGMKRPLAIFKIFSFAVVA